MSDRFSLLRNFKDNLGAAQRAFAGAQFEESGRIVALYDGLFPQDLDLLKLRADLAQRNNEFAVAEGHYATLARLNPDDVAATVMQAHCAANLGRRADALAIVEGVRKLKPDDVSALSFMLELLVSDRGLGVAITLLESEMARTGKRPQVTIERLRQKALSLFDAEEIRQADPRDILGLRESQGGAYTLRTIYEALEPIGANCEIGFAQRAHGAEPLSLFRWTSVTMPSLLALLSSGLEGYEDPSIYSLRGVYEREYRLYESRYETIGHTGVNSLDLGPEEFLTRVVRKQGFLKRKFLEDARKGEKIFAYACERALTDQEIADVDAQLVRLGVTRRLFAMVAGGPEDFGTVRTVADGCLVAFRSSPMPNIPFAEWDRIVVAAYDALVR